MQLYLQLFIFLSLLILLCESKIFDSSGITPCSRNKQNLNNCLVKNAQLGLPYFIKGIPEYRIPVMDPLFIQEALIKDRGRTGLFVMDTKFTNIYITGLNNTKIKSFTYNSNKDEIKWTSFIPSLQVNSNYSGSGRISVLPNRGQGELHLTAENVTVSHTFKLAEINKRNNYNKKFTYVTPRNSTCHFTTDNVLINIKNLFNNNAPEIENITNLYLNNHWKELYFEFGDTVSELFRRGYDYIFKRMTKHIPFNQIMP